MIIKIRVFRDSHDAGKFTTLYQTTVSLDNSCRFDFDKFIDVFSQIYPKSYIEFTKMQ